MRGGKHHVRYAGDALGPKDVVLDDEGIRFCGEGSTTSHTPATPRPAAGAPETPNHWRGHGAESHGGGACTSAGGPPLGGAPPRGNRPPKKDRRTVGPPNFHNSPNILNSPTSPTSPSGFSWSSSWIAASSGFWHVPARSGRSAAGPWSRTGSNNSCC